MVFSRVGPATCTFRFSSTFTGIQDVRARKIFKNLLVSQPNAIGKFWGGEMTCPVLQETLLI